ncbi:MAG: hypothetical protein ACPKPY_01070 [Nitrososphaeraceae archaeon]
MQARKKHDKNKKIIDKHLYGCPCCHLSRYVVYSESIKDPAYHKYEFYCHSCNVVFASIHAVLPIEITKEITK